MIFFARSNVGVAAMPLAQAPAARKLAIANKPATKSIAKARAPTNRDQEALGSALNASIRVGERALIVNGVAEASRDASCAGPQARD